MGAVNGAQFGLKMVTSATMKPPKTPPIIHGMAAPGTGECDKPQVHAAVATTQSRSRPVLLTVPCSVIASPKATWPLNAFSFNAGLDVRIRFAIREILPNDVFLIFPNPVLLNSTPWYLSFPSRGTRRNRSGGFWLPGDLALDLLSEFQGPGNLRKNFWRPTRTPHDHCSVAQEPSQRGLLDGDAFDS